MVRFIDDHRATYGVEPICAVLPIAPSTYFRVHAQHQDATKRAARPQRDDELRVEIQRVYDANFQVYGPRKVWHQPSPIRRRRVSTATTSANRRMKDFALDQRCG